MLLYRHGDLHVAASGGHVLSSPITKCFPFHLEVLIAAKLSLPSVSGCLLAEYTILVPSALMAGLTS